MDGGGVMARGSMSAEVAFAGRVMLRLDLRECMRGAIVRCP
jgi:hypothetical protein